MDRFEKFKEIKVKGKRKRVPSVMYSEIFLRSFQRLTTRTQNWRLCTWEENLKQERDSRGMVHSVRGNSPTIKDQGLYLKDHSLVDTLPDY